MELKHLSILFFIFFCLSNSFSQNDSVTSYIIINDSDTIYGSGSVSPDQKYCFFKSSDQKELIQYYPNEINAFRFIGGKYYVSRQVSNSRNKYEWYFLEFLVDGEIDLYTISNSGRFFIKKENTEFLELHDNIKSVKEIDEKEYMVYDKKFLGYLRAYMSDTPELFPKIDRINELNQYALVQISMDYHNAVCNEYECINYTKSIPKTIYKLEAISGLNNHNNYYSPHYGVLVHIWRPLKNEKLYFKTGILYSEKPYWKNNSLEKGQHVYSFKIPISFQYVFGKRAINPMIAFGFPTGIYFMPSIQAGFIYAVSSNFALSLNGSFDVLLGSPSNRTLGIYDNRFGHTINFGLIYQLK